MEQSRSRGKKWIWWLAAIPAALLLAVAGLYFLGNGGVSARFDDPGSYISARVPDAFEEARLAEDGTVELRLTREALYWLAGQNGLLDTLEEDLAAAGISQMGFRLANGRAVIHLRTRLMGFLPVTCRAVADVTLDADRGALTVRADNVHLGRYMPLARRLWPPALREDIPLSLGTYINGVRAARPDGDALVLTLDGLQTVPEGELVPEEELLTAMRIFIPEADRQSDPALTFLTGRENETVPARDIWEYALSSGDPGETLSDILSLCKEESVAPVLESMDRFPGKLLAGRLDLRRQELRTQWEGRVRSTQAQYERILYSFREMYKSGSLKLGENAFLNSATGDAIIPADMTTLAVTATDSRVIFLYSLTDSPEISTGDMPPISSISRATWAVMLGMLNRKIDYDLGVTLTSEGGVPLLFHRRQDGTFVMRQISDTLYVHLLVEHSNPILCVDELDPPGRALPRPSGEGWNGSVLLLAE